MTKLRTLTDKEHAAVLAYAFEHGRRWKACLRDDWMNARTTGILQALRNSHGPSWLVSYSVANRLRSSADVARTITVTADNGNIYEATKEGINEPWTINYPEGSDRFSGLEPELRAHIRRLISKGPEATIAP
ncbi:hypothetical protein ACCS60_28180 [Rhizobium acaciae]|uniref:hypothetical protein n=1 Tax=Rhizobium acaciae TaxID=2989736 RepID=UPI003F98C7BD